MCADDANPIAMDPGAPFFDLVLMVDRLTNRQQRETYRATVARHEREGSEWGSD